MKRLIEETVFSGLVIATIEGVVRAPSALGITTGSPPSITAIQEFVVPRSIPITFGTVASYLLLYSYLSVGMGLASILLPITRHVSRMDAMPIPTDKVSLCFCRDRLIRHIRRLRPTDRPSYAPCNAPRLWHAHIAYA